MYKNKKILAIIPARGGSKRLPEKNIKLLAGKPLISYTIETSLNSKLIDKTIVSTDDKEITEVSKNYGAEIIKRPKELAKDTSITIDAIKHTLDVLKEKENYQPDIIILLQPTTPLRRIEDINNAIEMFFNENCESVVSVCEGNPYWNLTNKNKAKPVLGWKYFKSRKQDLPKTFVLNGAIYITTPKSLDKYNAFFNNKMALYQMPNKRSIDIDEEIDFEFVEFIIKKGKCKQ